MHHHLSEPVLKESLALVKGEDFDVQFLQGAHRDGGVAGVEPPSCDRCALPLVLVVVRGGVGEAGWHRLRVLPKVNRFSELDQG